MVEMREFASYDHYAWMHTGKEAMIATNVPVKNWPERGVREVTVIADITGVGVHGEDGWYFKRTGSRKKAYPLAESLKAPIDIFDLERLGFRPMNFPPGAFDVFSMMRASKRRSSRGKPVKVRSHTRRR